MRTLAQRVKKAIDALRNRPSPEELQRASLRRFQEALQSFRKEQKGRGLGGAGPWSTTQMVDGKVAILPTISPIFTTERLIQESDRHLIPDTPANRHWAYDKEVSIRAMTKLIIESLSGAGWEFDGDTNACNFIEKFFDEKFDYEEFLDISITNLVRDGNQVWKAIETNENKIEGFFPLPWEHITVYRHPFFPWRTFILGGLGKEILIPAVFARMLAKGEKFTKEDWEKYDAQKIESMFMATTGLRKPFRYHEREVVFLAIDTKGTEIGQSPLVPILTLICYKKLLEWIACRCAELWSSPILDLTTGLPAMPPESPEDIKELRQRVVEGADLLQKYREFGVFSLPFDQKLGVHFPSRGVPDLTSLLTWLGKEIVLAILGSKALFEARGVELATSRTIKSVWDEALDGWRRRLKKVTDKQIIAPVLKSHEIKGVCKIKFKSRVWTEEEIKAKLQTIAKGEVKGA